MAKPKYLEWLTEENLIKIEGWARDGLTDEQIAHNMGINVSTLYVWKKEHTEISESLKKGKEVVDFLVENALLKRALGYEYEETITEKTQVPFLNKDGEVVKKEQIHIKKVVRHALPDVTAQIFWLKNRKPDKWRDKFEQTITGIEDLTPLAELLNADD